MTSRPAPSVKATYHGPSFDQRVAMHAALGDPLRLAIVDDLAVSDRAPKEIGERFVIPTNLLAHHLDVLEEAGLITRFASAGDGRRRYVRIVRDALAWLGVGGAPAPARVLFLCTHNSARSQLAAALWRDRTGRPADSAGTHPAPVVHGGAVAAARRAGLDLGDATPRSVTRIPSGTQVITVCDRAHEELDATSSWWHWSVPDPVEDGTARAFDAVVDDLDARIASLLPDITSPALQKGNRP